jgi:citrate lyase beta subunit
VTRVTTVSARVARAGRGTVEVVQQPNASNRWTAVIRVHDPQSGYGHYDVEAFWR